MKWVTTSWTDGMEKTSWTYCIVIDLNASNHFFLSLKVNNQAWRFRCRTVMNPWTVAGSDFPPKMIRNLDKIIHTKCKQENILIQSLYCNSEIDADTWSDLCYLICLTNLFRSGAVTNLIFFLQKRPIFFIRAPRVLSYHVVYVPWDWGTVFEQT